MAFNIAAAELVRRCFDARTMAHQFHLQAKSFAEHMALNEFYDEIVGLADDFAETFQGQYGILRSYSTLNTSYPDAIAMLRGLAEWIAGKRKEIADDSHIQNIIDEIVALTYSTIYKLVNLK